MKTSLVPLAIVVLCLSSLASFAQQQNQSSKPITGYSHGDPRYPTDSTTNWAIGAKRELPNELKTQLDAGGKALIIDVRLPADYAKETLPGAINIPLVELEGRLRQMPRDTYLVFTCGTGRASSQAAKLAEELGFKNSTFCPINKWKEQGYQAAPGTKN